MDKTIEHNTRASAFQAETSGLTATQIMEAYGSQPVCPRCESLAFRDQGWKKKGIATCPNCGWHGKTVCYDEYLTRRLYK